MTQIKEGLVEIAMKRAETICDAETIWDAGEVVPGLFIGSLRAALDEERLVFHGVKAVLTAAGRLNVKCHERVHHRVLDIADHPCQTLFDVLESSFQFLDEHVRANENRENSSAVLVHCASGISRSASICCAWLIHRQKISYNDAVNTVRGGRPFAMPNAGFAQQLQCLEKYDGDIARSRAEYEKSLAGYTVTELLIGLRDKANGIHRAVDDLEEQIKSTVGEASSRHDKLAQLLSKIDDLESQRGPIEDRVSLMIQNSARRKCLRLMSDLQMDSIPPNKIAKPEGPAILKPGAVPHIDSPIIAAATALNAADFICITAGAGCSADSGIVAAAGQRGSANHPMGR